MGQGFLLIGRVIGIQSPLSCQQFQENDPKAVDVTLVGEKVADEAFGVKIPEGSLDEHDERVFIHGLEY